MNTCIYIAPVKQKSSEAVSVLCFSYISDSATDLTFIWEHLSTILISASAAAV